MTTSIARQAFERVPSDPVEAFVELQGDLAIELEEALEEKGWTQRVLAERSKINEVNISRLISGESNPTIKTIATLQSALGRRIIRFSWVEQRTEELEFKEIRENAWVAGATHTTHILTYTQRNSGDERKKQAA